MSGGRPNVCCFYSLVMQIQDPAKVINKIWESGVSSPGIKLFESFQIQVQSKVLYGAKAKL